MCVCFSHNECYSECSCRGAIWLNLFATVLLNVCNAVTIECVFYTRVACVCLVWLLLCKEEGNLSDERYSSGWFHHVQAVVVGTLRLLRGGMGTR